MNQKIKQSLALTVGLILVAVAFASFGQAIVNLSANLGTNTVPPAASQDIITAASYNGNAPTSGIGTTSLTFPASTVATTAPLSITIKNNGQGISTIALAGITTGDGDAGNALSFVLTSPSTFPVTIAAGTSQTFTWTVTNVNTGTTAIQTTPTVTIAPSS
ncbi:MAG: hypothetical protein ABSA79_09130 [Candidatus Bathyarchaeia archaeon]|jgi:hypothetical protein